MGEVSTGGGGGGIVKLVHRGCVLVVAYIQ